MQEVVLEVELGSTYLGAPRMLQPLNNQSPAIGLLAIGLLARGQMHEQCLWWPDSLVRISRDSR